jgi:hypothetical protein
MYVTTCTNCFTIHVFRMTFTVNEDHLPKHHRPSGHRNGNCIFYEVGIEFKILCTQSLRFIKLNIFNDSPSSGQNQNQNQN